ncbi:hypothetical protein Prudu_710S000200, partial [Prunus dulcis]
MNCAISVERKAVEQGVQLRKRKRIIPMWKIIEGSELVQKTLPRTTRLQILVMQFGNVEAEIEFFASLVKADGWLKGDNHIILALRIIKEKRADEILKEELARFQLRFQIFSTPSTFMKK